MPLVVWRKFSYISSMLRTFNIYQCDYKFFLFTYLFLFQRSPIQHNLWQNLSALNSLAAISVLVCGVQPCKYPAEPQLSICSDTHAYFASTLILHSSSSPVSCLANSSPFCILELFRLPPQLWETPTLLGLVAAKCPEADRWSNFGVHHMCFLLSRITVLFCMLPSAF